MDRYLVAILTQDQFLAAITTEHFTLSTATPEIKFANCVQKINNDCALCVLKYIECFIEKRNELTNGNRSRNLNVDIRTWFDIEDATGLRAHIVDLFLDLSRKLEMLEINNHAVVGLAQKEKTMMKQLN